MEQAVDVFKTLVTEGLAGLWKWILEKLANLEDMVLGQIKDVRRRRRSSRPASPGSSACSTPPPPSSRPARLIYDIVMFFVERGSQIMEFVNSILDSIGAIAKGSVGVVADAIESALAKVLPLAISSSPACSASAASAEKIKIDHRRRPQADQQGRRRDHRRRRQGVQEDVRQGASRGRRARSRRARTGPRARSRPARSGSRARPARSRTGSRDAAEGPAAGGSRAPADRAPRRTRASTASASRPDERERAARTPWRARAVGEVTAAWRTRQPA